MSKLKTALVLLPLLALVIIGLAFQQPAQPPVQNIPTRYAVIVPHHDLVKAHRQTFWQTFLANHPKAKSVAIIILIGPDHFGTIPNKISYTDEDFSTYSGTIQNGLAKNIPTFPNVVKNTTLIKSDHAISVLLNELSTNFPSATLSPFLIGSQVKFSELTNSLALIKNQCAADCLVVASVDFSHGLTQTQADQKDAQTLTQLATLQVSQHSLIVPDHADCPACLYLVQELGRTWQNHWWFFDKTNSADFGGGTTDTVSHIYGGYLPSN